LLCSFFPFECFEWDFDGFECFEWDFDGLLPLLFGLGDEPDFGEGDEPDF